MLQLTSSFSTLQLLITSYILNKSFTSPYISLHYFFSTNLFCKIFVAANIIFKINIFCQKNFKKSMLVDFYLEGKLYGVKIFFQIFFKNYVRKKCINLLRKTFSNNIFRKKLQNTNL